MWSNQNKRVAGDPASASSTAQIERRVVQRALSQPRLDRLAVASDHRVRAIRACHAIDDREPVDRRDRRAMLGVHPCGARQLVRRRESTPEGEVRQRLVVRAHEHLECLARMSGGGFQRRGPDVSPRRRPTARRRRRPARRRPRPSARPPRRGPTSSNQTGERELVGRPAGGATTTARRRPPTCRRADRPGERVAGPWSSRTAARRPRNGARRTTTPVERMGSGRERADSGTPPEASMRS